MADIKFSAASVIALADIQPAVDRHVIYDSSGAVIATATLHDSALSAISAIIAATTTAPGLKASITADTHNRIVVGLNASDVAQIAAGPGNATQNAFLTYGGAAKWQLGGADAAAPVAQTVCAQSVVAGTTNTAGANLTIAASRGTGTGVGGSLIFQVAAAGSTGSSQNALATALTINSAKTATFVGAVEATAGVYFQSGGAGITLTNYSGHLLIKSSDQFSTLFFSNTEVRNASGTALTWTASTSFGGTVDTWVRRAAAATVGLGNTDAASPVAQTISVQNVVTGTSNTAGANFTLNGSRGTGTGVGGSQLFATAPAGGSGTSQNALVRVLELSGNGNVVVGSAAISTSATDGFLYLDSCAGTPSGVPTTYTGRVAVVYDTTNNKLAVYNGAWKQTAALT